MIVLRSWADQRAFVVVVILIAHIPIQSPVDLEREARLRRLVTHRIGRNQSARRSDWIGNPIALSVVLIDTIGREKRYAGKKLRSRINKEKVVSDVIQAMAHRMPDAIEKIFYYRIAGKPVVVIAGAKGDSRIRRPIE